jgi:hypothetical protein
MDINMTKVVPVIAKTLSISLKVRDCFTASLLDQDGRVIADYDGYVPTFMPGDHYGDYVMLDIDLESGQISNWKVPKSSDIQAAFFKQDDE